MLNANQLSPRDRVSAGRFSVGRRPRKQKQKHDKQNRGEKNERTKQDIDRLHSALVGVGRRAGVCRTTKVRTETARTTGLPTEVPDDNCLALPDEYGSYDPQTA